MTPFEWYLLAWGVGTGLGWFGVGLVNGDKTTSDQVALCLIWPLVLVFFAVIGTAILFGGAGAWLHERWEGR